MRAVSAAAGKSQVPQPVFRKKVYLNMPRGRHDRHLPTCSLKLKGRLWAISQCTVEMHRQFSLLELVIRHITLAIELSSSVFWIFQEDPGKGPLEDKPMRAEIFCPSPTDGRGGLASQNPAGCSGVLCFDFPQLLLTFLLMISPRLCFAIWKEPEAYWRFCQGPVEIWPSHKLLFVVTAHF